MARSKLMWHTIDACTLSAGRDPLLSSTPRYTSNGPAVIGGILTVVAAVGGIIMAVL